MIHPDACHDSEVHHILRRYPQSPKLTGRRKKPLQDGKSNDLDTQRESGKTDGVLAANFGL